MNDPEPDYKGVPTPSKVKNIVVVSNLDRIKLKINYQQLGKIYKMVVTTKNRHKSSKLQVK